MNDEQRIRQLLGQGEGLTVEFKEAHADLPRSLFETICAFLNREGGTVLLGVRDNGTVVGVDPAAVTKLSRNLVASANDPDKLSPICRLFPETVQIEGKTVLYFAVPQSSQVHRTNRIIYDRSADGDFRVTDGEATRLLYERKANFSTENRVIPYLELADLRAELFTRVRQMATVRQDGQHVWSTLSDADLLRSAGLYRRDGQTGQEGYTLAAVLLFGKNETILNALPYYEFDAILRQLDLDRYDDRDYMQSSLLDAYDRLMAFIRKHLADPFFLDGTQRVSLRDVIFREVIVNLLAHREYGSGYPARLIIYGDHVLTENASRTYHSGPLDPNRFTPYPKNPAIANVFREIGFMDRLGSGVRRISQYQPAYTPNRGAQFIEGDIFQTIIPIPVYRDFDAERRSLQGILTKAVDRSASNDTVNDTVKWAHDTVNRLYDTVNDPLKSRLNQELFLIARSNGATLRELIDAVKVARITAIRDLNLLREADLISFSGAPKTGRYVLTQQARQQLNSRI